MLAKTQVPRIPTIERMGSKTLMTVIKVAMIVDAMIQRVLGGRT